MDGRKLLFNEQYAVSSAQILNVKFPNELGHDIKCNNFWMKYIIKF